ncbi:MAG: dihydrodipicolinate synthase family protein [Culicoidibacterales bacterium]
MFLQEKILAVVTPYQNQEVDMESFHKYLNYLKTATPYRYFLVMGSTGDQQALTLVEKTQIMKELVEKHPDVNFMFGVSYPSTRQVKQLVNVYHELPITPAIMLGIPPYILPNQQEIMSYVREIAELLPTEILLYNNARRTGVNIEPETIATIFEQNPNIKALKEAGTNDLIALTAYPVYTGFDALMIDHDYFGCTSVIGSILPYTSYYFNSKQQKHTAEFAMSYQELLQVFGTIGLLKVIKYYLMTAGVIQSAEPMLPMQECSATEKKLLEAKRAEMNALEQQAKQYCMQLK